MHETFHDLDVVAIFMSYHSHPTADTLFHRLNLLTVFQPSSASLILLLQVYHQCPFPSPSLGLILGIHSSRKLDASYLDYQIIV